MRLLIVSLGLLALSACGPSISSVRINCDGGGGTVSWWTSGDEITLVSSAPIDGTGKVSEEGKLNFTGHRDTVFSITAASGDESETTGVTCKQW